MSSGAVFGTAIQRGGFIMRITRWAVLALLVVALTAPAALANFGAIAYSPSTGTWGTSNNCATRADAETLALAHCNAPDARVVAWVQNGYAALALGTDPEAYGWAWNNNLNMATTRAMRECSQRNSGCHIACWIYSD
jgi:Domain of unknown function (DUF4189)